MYNFLYINKKDFYITRRNIKKVVISSFNANLFS
jgi:hypothetical protein